MNIKQIRGALEAMLFAHAEPLTAARLAQVLQLEQCQVEQQLLEMQRVYKAQGHGMMLLQLEDTWQLCTKNEYSVYVKAILDKRKNTPLSQAAMEVLAIIAYNQPVSRSFVDQVRGVDSAGAVQTLLQKRLIEEAGRMDLPGRPISFQTTDVFLRTFGLESLSGLPALYDDMPESGDE